MIKEFLWAQGLLRCSRTCNISFGCYIVLNTYALLAPLKNLEKFPLYALLALVAFANLYLAFLLIFKKGTATVLEVDVVSGR